MPYTFPVIRGEQNHITFYQTNLEYGEIDSLVKLPKDLVADRLLSSEAEMQRKLNTANVQKMVDYLMKDNAFYSALTLFVVPRDFTEIVEGKEGYEFIPSQDDPDVGQLKIYSSCFLFTADGQHRAASIKEALKKKRSLASQKIPAVIMLFKSQKQVKQVFSDLNLNAKPVNKTIGYSFDTRDPLAIVTKQIEQNVPLFKERVNHINNSLPASADKVITLNVLYNCNDKLREALGKSLDVLEEDDAEIELTTQVISDVWDFVIANIVAWKKFQDGSLEEERNKQEENKKRSLAGFMRDNYLCALAIGWQAIAEAASAIVKSNPEKWQPIVAKVMRCTDWQKSNPDWQQICLMGDKVNNTTLTIKATTGYMFEQAGIFTEVTSPYLDALKEIRQLRNNSKK